MTRMKLIVLAVLMATACAACGEQVAASQPALADGSLGEARAMAWRQLTGGEFRQGDVALEVLLEKWPDDAASAQAKKLVDEFLLRRDEDEAERQLEHAAAALKAQALLTIAQSGDALQSQFELVRPQVRELREMVIDLLAAPSNAATYDVPEGVLTRLADDIKQSGERIDKIAAQFGDDSAAYAKIVTDAAANAQAALAVLETAARRQAWDDLDTGNKSLLAIRKQVEKAGEALDDFTALFSETPWRVALDRTRLAKETALDKEAFVRQEWVRQVEAGAKARAEQYAAKSEWYRALALYNGLQELAESNAAKQPYRESTREMTRRARVLALYGPPGAQRDLMAELDGAPEPAEDLPPPTPQTDSAPADNGKWKDYVRQVDARMVRDVIQQLEESYVNNVDYRQVLTGALSALRILAETAELRSTFPGLADAKARQEFIQNLTDQIAEARQRDLVRYFHVGLALNRAVEANNRTVQLPTEVLCVEFTSGMLDPLDEFSSMIWPSDWPDFKKQTMGHFSGVGIQIAVENGLLKVVSPLEDSPAYNAGIRAGDYIIGIDGETAKHIEIDEAVRRITGPAGSKVVLTIRRPGVEAPFDRTLIRADIQVRTVKGWKRSLADWDWMIDPEFGIGYIRLTSFTRDTIDELRAALAEVKSRGGRGVILDLRYNPGGYLKAAVDVADEFVRRGRIVSTKGRQQPESDTRANSGGAFIEGEVIVLVNKYSASAAEIVSGALSDLGRATIVGTRSFGKGSVQNLIPIRPDEAYLKLTTAYYYLPNGRCLHRTEDSQVWGVEPNIDVAVTPEQQRRWLDLRRDTEIIQQRSAADLDREMAEQLRADSQLDTALLLLRLKLMGGSAVATATAAK